VCLLVTEARIDSFGQKQSIDKRIHALRGFSNESRLFIRRQAVAVADAKLEEERLHARCRFCAHCLSVTVDGPGRTRRCSKPSRQSEKHAPERLARLDEVERHRAGGVSPVRVHLAPACPNLPELPTADHPRRASSSGTASSADGSQGDP
jgi:hypothetical protein